MTKRFFFLALLMALNACQTESPGMGSATLPAQVQRQQALSLSAQVQPPESIPEPLLAKTQAHAQTYADQVSKRRGIDLFYVHAVPVGLQLQAGSEQAWVLSFPGTSRLRHDLNLELRALVSGEAIQFNLNYSGPVTLGRSVQESPQPLSDLGLFTSNPSEGFVFELITGLPGQGVTETYEKYLEGLADFLRRRFQARPFQWDDSPLIYALHLKGTLQGFIFLNQRNRLILGERKYADLQSVVLINPRREMLASYTLVGFNPKTPSPTAVPVYTQELHVPWGHLFIFGEV